MRLFSLLRRLRDADEYRPLYTSNFDPDWYLSKNPDVQQAGLDPLTHYIRHGWREGRRPIPDFSPSEYLAAHKELALGSQEPFLHWLLSGKPPNERLPPGKLPQGKPASVNPKAPQTAAEALAMRAISIAQADGWSASLPLWQMLWDHRRAGRLSVDFRTDEILRDSKQPFQVVQPAGHASGLRYCVYTALFGDKDDLQPPVDFQGGVDLICFTDQDISPPGWKIIKVAATDDPLKQAKHYKAFPHLHLAEYDASLFVDANTVFLGDFPRFIERWCVHESFVAWGHPTRNDARAEAAAVLAADKAPPENTVRQIEHYIDSGLPRATGLVEAGFIWRDHNDKGLNALMSAWWSEMEHHDSWRDQISLCFLMWKTGVRPKILPSSLGSARLNPATAIVTHRPKVRRANLARSGKKTKVSILYSEATRNSGSTVMRGEQLAAIMGDRYSSEFDIAYTSDRFAPTDSVVLMTKGALQHTSPDDIARIKRKNIAVLADFVDDRPSVSIVPLVDVLVTSSIGGHYRALQSFPFADVRYLPHHFDPRIESLQAQSERFSAAYFGEPKNVSIHESITGQIELVAIDTKTSGSDWIGRLPEFSLHYAVRPKLGELGHKPFLKGFTAAQLGANIVVTADDGDARHYLGDEYPFLLKSREAEPINTMIDFARESFGGPVWKFGLEIMRSVRERSSPGHVAASFRRLLLAV